MFGHAAKLKSERIVENSKNKKPALLLSEGAAVLAVGFGIGYLYGRVKKEKSRNEKTANTQE